MGNNYIIIIREDAYCMKKYFSDCKPKNIPWESIKLNYIMVN